MIFFLILVYGNNCVNNFLMRNGWIQVFELGKRCAESVRFRLSFASSLLVVVRKWDLDYSVALGQGNTIYPVCLTVNGDERHVKYKYQYHVLYLTFKL